MRPPCKNAGACRSRGWLTENRASSKHRPPPAFLQGTEIRHRAGGQGGQGGQTGTRPRATVNGKVQPGYIIYKFYRRHP